LIYFKTKSNSKAADRSVRPTFYVHLSLTGCMTSNLNRAHGRLWDPGSQIRLSAEIAALSESRRCFVCDFLQTYPGAVF